MNAATSQGLSAAEASARLARDGPNELPATARRGALGLLRDVVLEPMFLLLVACGAIYLALGDRMIASPYLERAIANEPEGARKERFKGWLFE